MEQNLRDFVAEKAREMIAAYSCSPEAKAAAESWLAAAGGDDEAAETAKFIAELEQDVLHIEDCVAFTGSPMGIKLFGEERAKQMNEHARAVQAAGATYCDCPACTAGAAILARKAELL